MQVIDLTIEALREAQQMQAEAEAMQREAEAQRVRALAPQRAAERILVARLAVEFVEQHVVELTDRCLTLAHALAVDGGARASSFGQLLPRSLPTPTEYISCCFVGSR